MVVFFLPLFGDHSRVVFCREKKRARGGGDRSISNAHLIPTTKGPVRRHTVTVVVLEGRLASGSARLWPAQTTDTSLTSLDTHWKRLIYPPQARAKNKKAVITFKTAHYTIKQMYQSARGRGTEMPQCPYLYSHSSKLHNLGPEIGFPNLSLLIQSRPFKLCITAHCPPAPELKWNRWQFTYLPVESEGFFRHTFYFLNQLVLFAVMHDINQKSLKGPFVISFLFGSVTKKVYTFLPTINRMDDERGWKQISVYIRLLCTCTVMECNWVLSTFWGQVLHLSGSLGD